MKKFTISMCLILVVAVASAQVKRNNVYTKVYSATSSSSHKLSRVIDTLRPPSDTSACSANLTYYKSSSGYLTGNNTYGDKEKAEKYYFSGNGQVIGAIVLVDPKAHPSTTDVTSVKIYSIDATSKAPLNLMGTSKTVKIDSLSPTTYTAYTFTTPVAVTSNFAASFVLPTTTGDTAIVISTTDGCWSNDSLAWEFADYGGGYVWGNMNLTWGGLKIDLCIYPILNVTQGINNAMNLNGLSLSQNFPNPATGITTVGYELQDASEVSFQIINMKGQVVLSREEGFKTAGKYHFVFDTQNLGSGEYFYSLISNGKRITSKMLVK